MSNIYKTYIGIKSQGIEEKHLVYRKARIEEFLYDQDYPIKNKDKEKYFDALFALFDCQLGIFLLNWLKDKDPVVLFNRFKEYLL